MKCKNCNNEARWKSKYYDSPLCSECARKVVDELIKNGLSSEDESAVIDHFVPIHIDFDSIKEVK